MRGYRGMGPNMRTRAVTPSTSYAMPQQQAMNELAQPVQTVEQARQLSEAVQRPSTMPTRPVQTTLAQPVQTVEQARQLSEAEQAKQVTPAEKRSLAEEMRKFSQAQQARQARQAPASAQLGRTPYSASQPAMGPGEEEARRRAIERQMGRMA